MSAGAVVMPGLGDLPKVAHSGSWQSDAGDWSRKPQLLLPWSSQWVALASSWPSGWLPSEEAIQEPNHQRWKL